MLQKYSKLQAQYIPPTAVESELAEIQWEENLEQQDNNCEHEA